MIYIYAVNPMERPTVVAELKNIVGDVEVASYSDEKIFLNICKVAGPTDYVFLLDETKRRVGTKALVKRRNPGETAADFVNRICYEEGWGLEPLSNEKINSLYELSVKQINSQGLVSDDEVMNAIKANCAQTFAFSPEDFNKAVTDTFNKLRGYSILEELLLDSSYSEIMVNGCNYIFVEENGKVYQTDKAFESQEDLMNVARRIALDGGQSLDESNPMMDCELILKDGSRVRVNIVLPCIAKDGPIITIRKKSSKTFSLEDIEKQKDVICFLDNCVKAGYNIVISGGTGSGKTTLLGALSQKIGESERVIVIEDTPEIEISGKSDVIYTQTRKANSEGYGGITSRDLIRNSLRMRPDRLIVGEVRGGEVRDMLDAMNTGHDGSLTTAHANSSREMITRLVTMAISDKEIPIKAVRMQISTAINLIIQVSRMKDGSRRITEISEVVGMDRNDDVKVMPLWIFEGNHLGFENDKAGGLVRTKNDLMHREKFYSSGMSSGEVDRMLGLSEEKEDYEEYDGQMALFNIYKAT